MQIHHSQTCRGSVSLLAAALRWTSHCGYMGSNHRVDGTGTNFVIDLLVNTLSDSLSAHFCICGPCVCTGWSLLWQGAHIHTIHRHVSTCSTLAVVCVHLQVGQQSPHIFVWTVWVVFGIHLARVCKCVSFNGVYNYMCEWVCIWVHANIFVAMQAYISLHLSLGFSVHLPISHLQTLFFSKPLSHRVDTRDDLSEQLWDGKD